MPKTWWLRDLIYLGLFIAVLIGAWWALEYAVGYWPVMRYYNRILVLMGINIALAVSLNIINGHAGQFSLGHARTRSEEHTSELQSQSNLVCRLLLEKKKRKKSQRQLLSTHLAP